MVNNDETMQELANRVTSEAVTRKSRRGSSDSEVAAKKLISDAETKAEELLATAEAKATEKLHVAEAKALENESEAAKLAQEEADKTGETTLAVAAPGEPTQKVKIIRTSDDEVVIQTEAVEVQFKVKS